jgi:hypothetical protein
LIAILIALYGCALFSDIPFDISCFTMVDL